MAHALTHELTATNRDDSATADQQRRFEKCGLVPHPTHRITAQIIEHRRLERFDIAQTPCGTPGAFDSIYGSRVPAKRSASRDP
jgi:hypothetical protein